MRQERYGNAGAVESVESQKQAYPSFHEPLGNLANSGRDSHIPTAPTTVCVCQPEQQPLCRGGRATPSRPGERKENRRLSR